MTHPPLAFSLFPPTHPYTHSHEVSPVICVENVTIIIGGGGVLECILEGIIADNLLIRSELGGSFKWLFLYLLDH